ncbi:sulfite exporter TauE/SafE family protein [Limosilactobacillus agrestimuris]|uniref:sulfite exporter TauE/SafE family protein n=1 Tax=Limosilactobacillus agrestimuris TaxID=2941331 RepID=UPI002040E721|nr:sulfite exporter TauE/SafE family protein [Limosilactobacillus agrestimuris]
MASIPSVGTLIYLLLGGVVAGILSSAASFASLASYPLLLSVGVAPVYANVTNDAALIWNSLGSVFASGRELHGHWRQVWTYGFFTVIGSVMGCILLLAFPGKVFEKVVPFFILIAGAMILISGKHQPDLTHQKPQWLKEMYIFFLVIVGGYAGYFGAASGIVILVLLTYLTDEGFLVANAIKNAVCGFTNLVALIIYSFTSKIYWWDAFPMAIGMFIGGYLGPIILRYIPAKLMRWVIAFLALIQAIIFFRASRS